MNTSYSMAIFMLRLVGIWLLLSSFWNAVYIESYSKMDAAQTSGIHGVYLHSKDAVTYGRIGFLLHALTGVAFLGFAERLARRIVPPEAEASGPLTESSFRHLAVAMAGLFCVLIGITGANRYFWSVGYGGFNHGEGFGALLNLGLGGLFLFRTRQVAAWLAHRSSR